ncbi:basic membrane protein A [Cryobacterium mesophilum]|uniref:BMP family ABC transporter substrate-binding protein n=1 Tax=Terrimesophilobacter mesophilus TaxID=433647 RepID=A0A4R8VAM0_9MICO|nr:BMP family ABC transporter substrate-binding protein [Terrimesophilobacter mesophilus]MBB5633603.1 basic membrane protein A [Terrimesophilobacter mesophilus]TFB80301.1 BMP family ABC transporter substrate-binding protein [Terrimesophilobacter mesophilus]
MRITSRKSALAGLAVVGISTMLLAGCAPAPEAPGSSDKPAASDFLPCMVSDSGGFDDKSFNQLGKQGIDEAATKLGVKANSVESKVETDYAPNITSLIAQNCNIIVTVGFNLAAATKDAATANTDINFAIIDDNSIDLPNVKPIVFDTAQAAFLGGYAAASYSKSGIVGTFGGIPIPPVTIFMDGFYDGVQYYNSQKGKDVKVLGWDVKKQKEGAFTGGFEANDTAKSTAKNLIDQGADVILPVGGPIYQSAVQAIKDSGKDIALIGVDADVTQTDPDITPMLLTSIMKGIQVSVAEVVSEAAAGKFDNTPYVGTLANNGVGLAPFHDFASKVDPGLQGELDAIKAGIISGKITVESPSSPK